jgi:aspartyl/asparaginyl beta-hydroxylase (cupin superfamily)
MEFFIVGFLIIILAIYFLLYWNNGKQIEKFFFETSEICDQLETIDNVSADILNESLGIFGSEWNDWPEKYLYDKEGQWKIFPFFAFDLWVEDNCRKCPKTYKFLKGIKGLRLATFSKLSPGMKLKPHRGWASHSNYVIRCHFGLVVPEGCYVSVSDEEKEMKKYHKKFEWLIFDDSKTHYAENKSKNDRIVLILDIERPSRIKIGTSDIGDSKELIEIVNYFKSKNIKINQEKLRLS